MKKSLCVVMLCVVALAVPFEAYAKSRTRDILTDLGVTIIKEAIKNPGSSSKKAPEETPEKKDAPAPVQKPDEATPDSSVPEIDRAFEARFHEVSGQLESDLLDLARKIVANNKYALEAKLTKKERQGDGYDIEDSSSVWSRVWAKGKTIVVGEAEADKKFSPFYIVTGDPNYVFSNGIHVGADIKVIEDAIDAPISKINGYNDNDKGQEQGLINLDPTSFVFLSVHYKNNKITDIGFHNGYSAISQKAAAFVDKKLKEMGLREP